MRFSARSDALSHTTMAFISRAVSEAQMFKGAGGEAAGGPWEGQRSGASVGSFGRESPIGLFETLKYRWDA